MPRPRGLGKGLNSLIPEKTILENEPVAATPRDGILEVSVDVISTNPHQPRHHFDPNAMDDLAASIREHGVVQPLIVTVGSREDSYQLLAGERRLRASKMVGLKTVPVLVRTANEQQKLEIAILENVQRHDLTPIEEAIAYRRLMDEFGLTQEKVARSVGKGRASVANTLRLLLLPEDMQQALVDGNISEGHAKVLLSVSDERVRKVLFDRIVQEGLSVRGLERAIKGDDASSAPVSKSGSPSAVAALLPVLQQAEDSMRNSLGTPVRLKPGAKKGGKILISYFSDEELERLVERLI